MIDYLIWEVDNFLNTNECAIFIDKLYSTHDGLEIINSVGRKDTSLSVFIDDADFNKILNRINTTFADYKKHYDLPFEHIIQGNVKIQESITNGGFTRWHHEWYDKNPLREYSWIIYLNDDFEHGNTEFKFLNKSIEPKEGKLIIFPSSVSHTHRANPKLIGNKYILTGWYELDIPAMR